MQTNYPLNVLSTSRPWYADGLDFTCTQCGNCCTGRPGFVWISREEIVRLAEHLELTPQETVERYCRKIDGKFSLIEQQNARGEFDCVFLKEQAPPALGDTAPHDGPAEQTVQPVRTCSIYSVRPLQCRTWPFWESNLLSREVWDRSSQRCVGINQGARHTRGEIEALRDARDWPELVDQARS